MDILSIVKWETNGAGLVFHLIGSMLRAILTKEACKQVPVFIAGGINPTNIDELLSYQPDGIDVSSGIEENGKKSSELIRQLEERMNRNGSNVSR